MVEFLEEHPKQYFSKDNQYTILSLSKPCISDTYRNSSSCGPCMICPAHSKNNGSSGKKCEECSIANTSLCFPAAINEVNISKMVSYDQANAYPESPNSTQFEDILLQNILTLPTATLHCLFVSLYLFFDLFHTNQNLSGSL